MPDQQPTQPQPNRFQALCSGIEEYDHLPQPVHAPGAPVTLVVEPDHETQLDEEILAGLVSP